MSRSRRLGTVVGLVLLLTSCAGNSGGGLPSASHSCGNAPAAGGTGLLAGTVTLSSTGAVVSDSPGPLLYTPAPGDADIPVVPDTVIVVLGASAPVSSNVAVLTPVRSVSARGFGFKAVSEGCAFLSAPGLMVSVSVRSAVS